MGLHSCCNKQKVKRGLWSPEEDEKLINYISTYGHGCWSSVPRLAGLQRCGKSCRLRWINYLRPDLKRGSFSHHEASLIIELHRVLGNRWAQIAKHLPGRTDNEVKNFWNSSIKKRLISSKTSVFSTPNGSNLYPNNIISNIPNPQIDQIPNIPIIPPTPSQGFDPIESRFEQQVINFHANSSSSPMNYSIPFSWPCNNNNNNQNQNLILGFDHSYPNYNPILENQELLIENKGINVFGQETLVEEIGGLCGRFYSENSIDYFGSLMAASSQSTTAAAAEVVAVTGGNPFVVDTSGESVWGLQI